MQANHRRSNQLFRHLAGMRALAQLKNKQERNEEAKVRGQQTHFVKFFWGFGDVGCLSSV